MTTPFFSLTAAILYFGWLWHDRSAVERREVSPADQPTKKTNPTRKPDIAQRPPPITTCTTQQFNLNNQGTVIQEEIVR